MQKTVMGFTLYTYHTKRLYVLSVLSAPKDPFEEMDGWREGWKKGWREAGKEGVREGGRQRRREKGRSEGVIEKGEERERRERRERRVEKRQTKGKDWEAPLEWPPYRG